MIANKIILIFFLKIIQIKANANSLCIVSSDYVPNLLSNLVFEYKFTELQSTKIVLTEMKKFLDEMNELWTEATDYNSNYDLFMYRFFYITEEFSRKATKAIETLGLIGAQTNDTRVITVAEYINRNEYDQAMKAYNTLGNEGLLFAIVEMMYNAFPNYYTPSITKLIKFTEVLLKKRKIKPVVTICLAIFKEMIKSKNIFTSDMMYFAEFIGIKYTDLNREYYHVADYEMLKEQLDYIKKSLPQIIQDTVFGHSFHPTEHFYLKNIRWGEHLFVADFFHGNSQDRRIAYSWEVEVGLDKKKWKLKFDMERMGYFIISHDYDEYLYAPDDSVLYNSTNRPIFTRKGYGSIQRSVWLLEPITNQHFLIKNQFFNEYIYVPEDRTFADEYSKRRVFSYTMKNDYLVPQSNAALWMIERA